jgi:hypothetical protein
VIAPYSEGLSDVMAQIIPGTEEEMLVSRGLPVVVASATRGSFSPKAPRRSGANVGRTISVEVVGVGM